MLPNEKSQGGGQIQIIGARTINPDDIAVPKGYKVQAVKFCMVRKCIRCIATNVIREEKPD
jgi:hypothetical protein